MYINIPKFRIGHETMDFNGHAKKLHEEDIRLIYENVTDYTAKVK